MRIELFDEAEQDLIDGFEFYERQEVGLCPYFLLRSVVEAAMEDYRERITIEPGKRGGRPCIRHMRITVYDVLDWLAQGMSEQEILEDYPELTTEDIRACLSFAAHREHNLTVAAAD